MFYSEPWETLVVSLPSICAGELLALIPAFCLCMGIKSQAPHVIETYTTHLREDTPSAPAQVCRFPATGFLLFLAPGDSSVSLRDQL